MILTVRPRLSVQIHNRSSIRKVCDLKKTTTTKLPSKRFTKISPEDWAAPVLPCSDASLF